MSTKKGAMPSLPEMKLLARNVNMGEFYYAEYGPPKGYRFDGITMYPAVVKVRMRKEAGDD